MFLMLLVPVERNLINLSFIFPNFPSDRLSKSCWAPGKEMAIILFWALGIKNECSRGLGLKQHGLGNRKLTTEEW